MQSNIKQRSKELHEFSGTGVLFALIVLIGDGIQPIIRHTAPTDTNNLLYTLVASLVEFVLIIPITLVMSGKKRRNKRARNKTEEMKQEFGKKQVLIRLMMMGCIFAICSYLLLYGLNQINSVTGIIAIKTQPISMIVIGFLMLGEKVNFKEILCAILIILGAIFVATEGTMMFYEISESVIILLVIPIFWNIGHAIAKPLLKNDTLNVYQLVLGRIGFVSLFLAIFYIIGDRRNVEQLTKFDYLLPMFSMGFLWLILQICWYNGLKHLKLAILASIV
ncbi:MAG: EamA family transporter, partial [Candidatus Lokiarchaeota archaeon]|nr:EamA family transporter [Candidatus Lokiarchaeota archaeon]